MTALPHPGPRSKRAAKKTFTGCWRCRERKVRCDGSQPSCKTCVRRGEDCPGYSIRLVWIGHESQHHTENTRRSMAVGSTWSGHDLLSAGQISKALERLDDGADQGSDYEDPDGGDQGPFGVFALSSLGLSYCSVTSLLPLPVLPAGGRELLYHYVTSLAGLMMPVEENNNPWRTVYPRLALSSTSPSRKALLHALLAHSALHLNNTCPAKTSYRAEYLFHYGEVLRELCLIVQSTIEDHVGFLACLRTLIMLDVYSNEKRTSWQKHLSAGWSLLVDKYEQCSGRLSDEEWTVAQSLCLARLRLQTAGLVRELERLGTAGAVSTDRGISMLKAMARDSRFGFSIGAQSIWLRALTDLQAKATPDTTRQLIQNLEGAIVLETLDVTSATACSSRIFQLGLLIYLKRRAAAISPRAVACYVSAMFSTLSSYVIAGGQESTVWPIFFAAVEAVDQADKEQARDWLRTGLERGIAGRAQILQLLEAVWARRSDIACIARIPADLVIVDWNAVAQELDLDVPLIS